MSRYRPLIILAAATLAAIALVYWFGHEHSADARSFLRALRRAL